MSKTTEPLPDRRKHLEDISGLRVTVRKEKGQNVFEFYRHTTPVYAAFTYPKAKAFALGVCYGQRITMSPEELKNVSAR
jgi:hypothetical protein